MRNRRLLILSVALLGVITFVVNRPAGAQTFTVLHHFASTTNGMNPTGVAVDKNGNIFGALTTCNENFCSAGTGVVYELTASGHGKILHRFAATTFFSSFAPALDGSGNVFGVDVANNNVFKITPAGVESVVYHFTGAPGGSSPSSALVFDSQGNLYGETGEGGAFNLGTVFKITPNGTETVLHSFAGGLDGEFPGGLGTPLVFDHAGNLYGITLGGGSQAASGVIFKITPAGQESIFVDFGKVFGIDAEPDQGLTIDASGNIYGATAVGGGGSVFRVSPSGSLTVLHSFGGGGPTVGPTFDAFGNLFGAGAGYLFEIFANGAFATYPTIGSTLPAGSMALDRQGNLYGATITNSGNGNVLYKFTP